MVMGGSADWWTDNELGIRNLGFNSDSTSHNKVDPGEDH